MVTREAVPQGVCWLLACLASQQHASVSQTPLFSIYLYLSSPHQSLSLADRWGTTADFISNFLHSSLISAFQRIMFHSRPVHSLMLSSNRFLCLPLRLPPCTVLCRIVLASPDDRVTCPYHFNLRLFTEIRGRYHGGRRPSSDDSLHSPTVIPPSALDKPSIMKRYHRRPTTR